MSWKKLGKALLFPHIAIRITLIPISAALLVCSMVFIGTESVIAYISYVLSAYTLTVWCVKISDIIKFFKKFKNENKYMVRWRGDPQLRVKVSLYTALGVNTAYAIFQLYLGVYHGTFWYCSIGAYYLCLVLMRWLLLRHTARHVGGERLYDELRKYRICGWVFLVINLYISVITLFMIKFERTFEHHMITTIAMAAYTFGALSLAIVNVIKFRKYKSPVFSASKAISLTAACVSMLTLESTMLTTFGSTTVSDGEKKLLLALTGAGVCAFVIAAAIYMIVKSTKGLKDLKAEENNGL